MARVAGDAELVPDPVFEPGRRRHLRQQHEQFLAGERQFPDVLPAGVTPVELRDGLGPLATGEHAERQFRRDIRELVAIHTRYTITARTGIARSGCDNPIRLR